MWEKMMPGQKNKKESYIIEEYKSNSGIVLKEPEDLEYLERHFLKGNNKAFQIDPLREKKVKITNSSYAGVVELSDKRLYFSNKVDANVIYMLSFLTDIRSFIYDEDSSIDVEMGGCFFDCIGKFFLNELDEMFKKGIYKSYVKKEENVIFIKGKILHKEQVANYIRCRPKQMCRYEELTYDNNENRIVIKALSLLVSLVKENKEVKKKLLRYLNILKGEVSLVNIEPEMCKRIKLNRLNMRYKEIISLSYVILKRYFIRSTNEGTARGFNFIVDMNKLYEDFLTAMIKDVVSERMKKYTVARQAHIRSLERNGRILTKPDILIKSRHNNETAVIIDAKYKKSPSNDDYYQVIAYSLAIPHAKNCALIYPVMEKRGSDHYCIDRDLMDPREARSIKLSVYYIDIEDKKDQKFEVYIDGIKAQTEKILDELVKEDTL